MHVTLTDVAVEHWPIAGTFTISRGSRTEATVVVAHVSGQGFTGRGEAVPYGRYGETVDGVVSAIRAASTGAAPLTRERILRDMPAGAARNALDCALVDHEAKLRDVTAAEVLGIEMPAGPLPTCFTLSLDVPAAMAAAAMQAVDKPLLKLKLGGGPVDADRMVAVRRARPDARLVADANESWSPGDVAMLLTAAVDAGIELVEQPLPAGADEALSTIDRQVLICADESAHTSADIPRLAHLYDAVNIKLDKAGGLTAALAMAEAARGAGLRTMVGCMVSTSLAMAPAWLLAPYASWLDLDGPLLLARDRTPAITYCDGLMQAPPSALWG
ncbi:MAG: N-acetyl-D-Glu racemase DgcA [Hyphomicrobiaceae bacterium]|nr:N-acetyl-D-Glu racemase DgcA [Hyphomicrobiaceae bacterium]